MPAVAPEDRVTRSETELHVGLDVPRNTAKQIHNWVKDQDWPAGTTLEEPSEYHVTLLYAPDGHHHKDSWWVQHLDHAKAKIDRFESFPGGPDGHPYVLRIDSPEIQEHANTLLDHAENAGLPITRFPGGYKPHLTIGYGPQEVTGLNVPNYEFDLGPSSVSDPRPPKPPEDPPITASFTVEPWDPHENYRSDTLASIIGHTDIDAIELALRRAGYPADDITLTAAVQTAVLLEKFGDPSGDLSYLLHHSGVFDDAHPWKPGMYGKGMLSPMGSPVLWATDATPGDDPVIGAPDHTEVEMRMQWPTMGAKNYFYVYPDGGVENATLDPEGTSRFVHVHPALYPKPPRDPYTEFSSAEFDNNDLDLGGRHGANQTRCLNCQSPLVNGECLRCSTVSSEVMNPDDHWNPGPLGEPPDKHHDVQIGNDWAWRTSASPDDDFPSA